MSEEVLVSEKVSPCGILERRSQFGKFPEALPVIKESGLGGLGVGPVFQFEQTGEGGMGVTNNEEEAGLREINGVDGRQVAAVDTFFEEGPLGGGLLFGWDLLIRVEVLAKGGKMVRESVFNFRFACAKDMGLLPGDVLH